MKNTANRIIAFIFIFFALSISGCGDSYIAVPPENTNNGTTSLTEAEQLQAVQAAIQSSNANWVADTNEITALSAEEQDLLNGDIMDVTSAPRTQGRSSAREAAALPASIDWRSWSGSDWMTSIKNQGSCSSCVAFASIGVMEALSRIVNNNSSLSIDLSEADLFSCAGRVCSTGWNAITAADRLRDSGVSDEACLPYSIQNTTLANTCDSKCTTATPAQIADFDYIYYSNSADSDTAATWIKTKLQQGPVVGSMKVYDDFRYYKSGIYQHVTGSDKGGHAIIIVGYSDTDGYWIIKNSWGTTWGEDGYGRIKYGEADIEKRVAVSYTVSSATSASVTAAMSPVSGTTAEVYTLICTVAGGSALDTNTIEGRCAASDAWSAVSSGLTMSCAYSTPGSYTPSCRLNGASSDDVDAAIIVTEPDPVCGNSTVETGETCDDGNTVTETCTYGQTSCTVCSSTCQSAAGAVSYCGNGAADTANGEQCDDGNTVTETCTYGQTSCTVCSSTCQNAAGSAAYCGDSAVASGNGETCDDGSTAAGDGCDANCHLEGCAMYNGNQTGCQDTMDAYLCYYAGTGCYEQKCVEYPSQALCEADYNGVCAWNSSSSGCYNTVCSANATSAACAFNTSCGWSVLYSVCYSSICTENVDVQPCDGAGCTFSSGGCITSSGGFCAGIGDQPTCDANTYCLWSGGACIDNNTTSSPCYTHRTPTACGADASCTWDSMMLGGFCN